MKFEHYADTMLGWKLIKKQGGRYIWQDKRRKTTVSKERVERAVGNLIDNHQGIQNAWGTRRNLIPGYSDQQLAIKKQALIQHALDLKAFTRWEGSISRTAESAGNSARMDALEAPSYQSFVLENTTGNTSNRDGAIINFGQLKENDDLVQNGINNITNKYLTPGASWQSIADGTAITDHASKMSKTINENKEAFYRTGEKIYLDNIKNIIGIYNPSQLKQWDIDSENLIRLNPTEVAVNREYVKNSYNQVYNDSFKKQSSVLDRQIALAQNNIENLTNEVTEVDPLGKGATTSKTRNLESEKGRLKKLQEQKQNLEQKVTLDTEKKLSNIMITPNTIVTHTGVSDSVKNQTYEVDGVTYRQWSDDQIINTNEALLSVEKRLLNENNNVVVNNPNSFFLTKEGQSTSIGGLLGELPPEVKLEIDVALKDAGFSELAKIGEGEDAKPPPEYEKIITGAIRNYYFNTGAKDGNTQVGKMSYSTAAIDGKQGIHYVFPVSILTKGGVRKTYDFFVPEDVAKLNDKYRKVIYNPTVLLQEKTSSEIKRITDVVSNVSNTIGANQESSHPMYGTDDKIEYKIIKDGNNNVSSESGWYYSKNPLDLSSAIKISEKDVFMYRAMSQN
jgi:hypothetical protein